MMVWARLWVRTERKRIGALAADEDRVHRGLHVVVDALGQAPLKAKVWSLASNTLVGWSGLARMKRAGGAFQADKGP